MAPFAEEMQRLDCRDEETVVSELKIPMGMGRGVIREGRARDWSGYLTRESEARRPSALKAAFQHLGIPGIISLGGGLPLPAYFPIHEVVVTVPTVGKWSEEETANEGSAIKVIKYAHHANRTSITNGVTKGITNGVNGVTEGMGKVKVQSEVPTVVLSTTLQYGLGTGDPHLISFLKQHTQMVHNPPYEDWSTTLTCGNTYSFYTCLRMLVERGDYLIMEEYAYSSAISTCSPMGIKILGIEMDEQGMTATGLDRSLSNWDVFARGARKPRVIYLVPYFSFRRRGLISGLDRTRLARQCTCNDGKISTEFVKNIISSSSKTNHTISYKWTLTRGNQLLSQISPTPISSKV
jgi:hypothetical protein